MKVLIIIEGGCVQQIFSDDPDHLEIEVMDLDDDSLSRAKKEKMVNYVVMTQKLKEV